MLSSRTVTAVIGEPLDVNTALDLSGSVTDTVMSETDNPSYSSCGSSVPATPSPAWVVVKVMVAVSSKVSSSCATRTVTSWPVCQLPELNSNVSGVVVTSSLSVGSTMVTVTVSVGSVASLTLKVRVAAVSLASSAIVSAFAVTFSNSTSGVSLSTTVIVTSGM